MSFIFFDEALPQKRKPEGLSRDGAREAEKDIASVNALAKQKELLIFGARLASPEV